MPSFIVSYILEISWYLHVQADEEDAITLRDHSLSLDYEYRGVFCMCLIVRLIVAIRPLIVFICTCDTTR